MVGVCVFNMYLYFIAKQLPFPVDARVESKAGPPCHGKITPSLINCRILRNERKTC